MNFAQTEFYKSVYTPDGLLFSETREIVFSGKSNVGKSSLINKFAGRRNLARVSSAPGKTASINYFRCGSFYLVDLPGYGYAKVSMETKRKWAELVEGYFAGKPNIALLVQLIDIRHGPSEYDMDMLRFVRENNLPFVAALTKCDKLKKSQVKGQVDAFLQKTEQIGEVPYIVTSAETGEGIEQLRAAAVKAAGE